MVTCEPSGQLCKQAHWNWSDNGDEGNLLDAIIRPQKNEQNP